jgi:acyl carrier protein
VDTKDIIRDFITSNLLKGTLESRLADEDELVQSGIIDSLGIMTMLSFLEQEFNIQISGEDLIPENFATVSAIAKLVDLQQSNIGE